MIESYKDSQHITSSDKLEEDHQVEVSLRPNSFNDFVGQKETVENLKIYIAKVEFQQKSRISKYLYLGLFLS